MKAYKIILGIIAVVAVFFCGVAYQSYSNHTEEPVESKDTVATAKTQEEIDADNEKFYEEYEKERLAEKEATKEEDPEWYANRYQDYEEIIIGMWEPILQPNARPFRYKISKNGVCSRYYLTEYEPHEWKSINDGRYTLSGNQLKIELKRSENSPIEKDWTIQNIQDDIMMVTYEEYDKFSKTYKTCELKLKRIK